jgi:hypothetical protein
MFRKSLHVILIAVFLNLLAASCSDRGVVDPSKKISQQDVTLGEVHNQFVKGFMKRYPNRCTLRRDEYIKAYFESVEEVSEENNYDFVPTEQSINACIAMFDKWRDAGIWDVYNPLKYSPYEAIDGFVEAGYIPEENAAYLRTLLDELIQPMNMPRKDGERPVFHLPSAPSRNLEPARDLLQRSCELWYKEMGSLTPPTLDIIDPDWDLWVDIWKKIGYYVAIGIADGLAGWGAGTLTANPFIIGAAAGMGSTLMKDLLDGKLW